MEEPFWEPLYRDDSVYAFGAEPSDDVRQMADHFPPGGRILDIGCGDGKNSLYLAEHGFRVDAFDLSTDGVAKLLRLAEKRQVSVNAWPQDLAQFAFSQQYDAILSHGVLFFVEKADWQRLLQDAKEHTAPGGYHLIKVFTNAAPVPPDLTAFVKGLFDEGELSAIYADWEIVEATSRVFQDQHAGGEPHMHAVESIVARKPR